MSLPVNITDLLNARTIESDRIEFKTGWNPDAVYRSVCAFANDFDNIGGGYILIGVSEEKGKAMRPVIGLTQSEMAHIQKEMIGYNNIIRPAYAPRVYIEPVDGKDILVLWVPGGNDRPYEVPESVTAKHKVYKYFIRRYASSIEAKGSDREELIALASQIPFDDRTNRDAGMDDISLVLLRDFLRQSGSRLSEQAGTVPVVEIMGRMNLLSGPPEKLLLRNAALLLFCENPEKFFPYACIDLVHFTRGPADRSFTEKRFSGPVQMQIRQALDFMRSTLIMEKVIKIPNQAEALRVWNYPYEVVEEAVVNAVYHRNYQEHEPITIRMEADKILIYNVGGPDRSIRIEDLNKGKVVPRRYRNRRLGDFLKELDLTEGRATGLALIRDRLERNGSPAPLIETDDERSWFQITLFLHPEFEAVAPIVENISDTILMELQKALKTANDMNDQADDQLGDQAANEAGNQATNQATNQAGTMNDRDYLYSLLSLVVFLGEFERGREELLTHIGVSNQTFNLKRYIEPLERIGWIEKTIPDKPTSPKQKYRLSSIAQQAMVRRKD